MSRHVVEALAVPDEVDHLQGTMQVLGAGDCDLLCVCW